MKLTRKRIKLFGILSMFIISTVAQPVFADDIPFFSSNDILFYSSTSACPAGSNTAIIGNDNAEKIFKFLTSTNFKGTGDKPFNAIQAAGALGNFQQESGMDPSSVEPNGAGHGLAQWTAGRWDRLQQLASSEGKDWKDLSLQLKMIQNELNNENGYSAEGSGLLTISTEYGTFAPVTDPAKASFIFQKSYERAGTPAQEKRDSAANAYYAKFKDLAPSSSSSSSSGSVCGSGLSSYMDKNFTIYNQCQYPPYGGDWGQKTNAGGYTACATACGPTSLAMAIKNMTGQSVTPQDTINYYDQQKLWASAAGYGNGSWIEGLKAGADHWGLRTETLDTKDINAYKDVFSKGGLIILAGKGGAPFMPQGHYIVVRGITDDGKFRIADPGQGTETNGTPDTPRDWDAALIMGSSQPAGSAAVYKK